MYEGQEAKLSCEVNYAEAEVVWYINDKEISNGDKYAVLSEGATRRLTILVTDLCDNGAHIAAKVGDKMTVANLTVTGIIIFYLPRGSICSFI